MLETPPGHDASMDWPYGPRRLMLDVAGWGILLFVFINTRVVTVVSVGQVTRRGEVDC